MGSEGLTFLMSEQSLKAVGTIKAFLLPFSSRFSFWFFLRCHNSRQISLLARKDGYFKNTFPAAGE